MKKGKLEKQMQIEIKELNNIERSIKRIKDKVVDKTPSHFSMKVIFNALFGSLLFGLTFILKGALIDTALKLEKIHIILILISSMAIIIGEIYFLGYSKIKYRRERRPGQFVIKRFLTLLIVSVSVAFFLVYIFGIDRQLGNFYNIIRVVIMTMMPCVVGAGFSSLFKE